MKTSFVLLALIVLNTSALLSEPLSDLVKSIPTWLFVVFEVVLLLVLYLNNILKDLNRVCGLDFNGIEFFAKSGKD